MGNTPDFNAAAAHAKYVTETPENFAFGREWKNLALAYAALPQPVPAGKVERTLAVVKALTWLDSATRGAVDTITPKLANTLTAYIAHLESSATTGGAK